MLEGLAAQNGGMSIPFVQSLPAVIGGIALIYVAYRTSRAEHRRWLRQERLKAYCTFLEIAEVASSYPGPAGRLLPRQGESGGHHPSC